MKKLFVALMAMTTSLAFAADIKLLEVPAWGARFESATFVVNQALGRAWVEVDTGDNRFQDSDTTTYQVKVEGLSYDAATKNVVMEHEGRSVVCGTLYKRRFVIGNPWEVRKSGNCPFKSTRVNVSIDDGFDVRRVRYLRVYMSVK